MSEKLMGISLLWLEDPIRTALKTYQEISNNRLLFAIDEACKIELTPDKPNSARSATVATFEGLPFGTLYMIAFKPGDGTGSEVDYQISRLIIDHPYPKAALIVPRNKVGVHSEVHLTIMRHALENPNADPELYAGTYDLLGLAGNSVKKMGQLGHPETIDTSIPIATFTVGYRGSERFGDPHAVYSPVAAIQVCAFLAISNEVHQQHPQLLNTLHPRLPMNL